MCTIVLYVLRGIYSSFFLVLYDFNCFPASADRRLPLGFFPSWLSPFLSTPLTTAVDSASTPQAAVSSPGAQGVAFNDNAEDATGGSPSSAGGTVLKNSPRNGAQAGAGGGGPRANGVDYRSSRDEEGGRFARPLPAEGGVSGGYAAAQA